MIKEALFVCALLLTGQTKFTSDSYFSPTSPLPESNVHVLDNSHNFNISILIDLSDRIDTNKYPNPTMEYFQRDTGYISLVVRAFKYHVTHKRLNQVNDRLRTYIDPEPQNPEIVKNLVALKVELNKNNVSRELLTQLPVDYVNNAARIYDQAIADDNFVGSNIWRFFKSQIKDYCLKEDYHNVLVILTDGYMYHPRSRASKGGRTMSIGRQTFTELGLTSSNWKSIMDEKDLGFYPTGVDLNGLKVIVLGLNPNPENPFEEDVLRAYWTKWLGEMGINEDHIMIKHADLPINLNESIQNFILGS